MPDSRPTLTRLHAGQTGLHFFDKPAQGLSGGDQGDGTYRNLILFADYSDPDVIRVGDTFYMVTSTFHLNPGITILESKDLVNWSFVGHAIENMANLSQCFSFNTMTGYKGGIWAPSIRYHEGMFYIHVGGPRIGLIVCKSKDIRGPWTVKRMKFRQPWTGTKLIDCCPLWDVGGKAYFAAAEPNKSADQKWHDYHIYLFEMSPDGETLLDSGVVVHGGYTTEAVKLYKHGDYYYIFYSEHAADENRTRTQFAARSKNIYGPYDRRKLIHTHGGIDKSPNQGGLVEAPDGNWWFLCHREDNAPNSAVGRHLMLLPVSWQDGWPIIGVDQDGDGVGEMVWEHQKPVQGHGPYLPASSDEFDSPILGAQWQWNHQDRRDKWSLTARPGFLRLTASRPVFPGGFYRAANTLTQRLMGESSTAVVKMDVTGMADGQYAGLCLFSKPSLLLGVYCENGVRRIRYQYAHWEPLPDASSNAQDDSLFCEDICEFAGEAVFLRMVHSGNRARLFFSGDGKEFTPVDEPREFAFFGWRGGRVGMFSYNEFNDGGDADFAWFHYQADSGDSLE